MSPKRGTAGGVEITCLYMVILAAPVTDRQWIGSVIGLDLVERGGVTLPDSLYLLFCCSVACICLLLLLLFIMLVFVLFANDHDLARIMLVLLLAISNRYVTT